MNDFLIYILKSTISISLLYLGFRMLMRKETFFKLNRALLLSAVVCSAIIPLLYLPQIIQPAIQNQWMPRLQNPEITQIAQSPLEGSTQTFTFPTEQTKTIIREEFPWMKLLQTVYLAGILITLLILIHGIVSILILFRKAQFRQMDGFRLLIIDHEIPPFSFGRFVIISQSDYDAHQQAILAHEQAHIRLKHFFDLALLETTKAFHWFNPVIYWLIRDMKEIHEFQADEYTLNIGIDATQYQILIIQKSVGSQRFALANSFNHCQIKKRITMMNKQKTSKARRWKMAIFLPLLALLLMAFSKTGERRIEKNTTNEKFIVNQSSLKNDVQPKKNSSQLIKTTLSENAIEKNGQPKQTTEKTIKGKVVDANNRPLEGASVVVSGKTIGTVTDKDGVFSLNLNDASPIVISYVGFKSVKLAPDFEKLMDINLEPENIGIDKVVVVAYGIQKKQESATKESNNEGNPNSSNKKIFTIVEQMPEFPGGSIALRKYIAQQVKYPVSAQEAGIQGNVFVSFVVNSFGAVSDVKVAKSVHPALDHEAIRVIYSMPKWKPGFQQGKAVDVAFTMPIEFILQYDPPVPSAK